MWFLNKSWTTPKGRVLTPDDADELLETLSRLEARVEHVEAALGYSVDDRGDVVTRVNPYPGRIDHSN
jgi:hypothetical protein